MWCSLLGLPLNILNREDGLLLDTCSLSQSSGRGCIDCNYPWRELCRREQRKSVAEVLSFQRNSQGLLFVLLFVATSSVEEDQQTKYTRRDCEQKKLWWSPCSIIAHMKERKKETCDRHGKELFRDGLRWMDGFPKVVAAHTPSIETRGRTVCTNWLTTTPCHVMSCHVMSRELPLRLLQSKKQMYYFCPFPRHNIHHSICTPTVVRA